MPVTHGILSAAVKLDLHPNTTDLDPRFFDIDVETV